MSKQTIFKLNQQVTKDDLMDAGFLVVPSGAVRETACGDLIYIPLSPSSLNGYRVIQYDQVGTDPEDLNPRRH